MADKPKPSLSRERRFKPLEETSTVPSALELTSATKAPEDVPYDWKNRAPTEEELDSVKSIWLGDPKIKLLGVVLLLGLIQVVYYNWPEKQEATAEVEAEPPAKEEVKGPEHARLESVSGVVNGMQVGKDSYHVTVQNIEYEVTRDDFAKVRMEDTITLQRSIDASDEPWRVVKNSAGPRALEQLTGKVNGKVEREGFFLVSITDTAGSSDHYRVTRNAYNRVSVGESVTLNELDLVWEVKRPVLDSPD